MASEITLGTKGLIQSDGTFCLQPSDFSDLSLFIEAVLSSNLANDARDAYGHFPSGQITLATGNIVTKDNLYLDLLNSYNSTRALSGNLYEITSPMIAMLCTKIADYASHATTVYGMSDFLINITSELCDLFAQFRAYSNSPTHDGPRTLIVNTVNSFVTDVDFLVQLSSTIFDEFKKFEEGVTVTQATLSGRLKIMKDVEAYLQQGVDKSKTPNDKRNAQTKLQDSILVENDISKITGRWQPALTGLQLLMGGWLAIKTDLESVKRIVQNESMFTSGKLLLSISEKNVIRQWRELGDEAAKYTGKGRSFLIRS